MLQDNWGAVRLVLHIFDVSVMPKRAKESDAESTKDAEVRCARVVHECDFFKNTNTHGFARMSYGWIWGKEDH